MIVRTLEEAEKSDRKVQSKTWDSVRLLLKDDNMGFSFHITTLYAGTETRMHYKNHLESVYCMEGEAEIETLADGKKYEIKPGTIYILDQHDEHILRVHKEVKMACVFNPPVTGQEVHDESGAYPLVVD
ncbi:L-ectoine synthase [Tepidicaulis marinus]|uniref:L-ectoine synthase n=1 Tax=Tepidicaulis marinus TaxID=1333998 RepID=A0A081BBU4_9HYPH|nr:ectoine synthase [Tepidicaulis marinus]GAK45512.1 L-ectoine synthase [Tepidicaulis marinus]